MTTAARPAVSLSLLLAFTFTACGDNASAGGASAAHPAAAQKQATLSRLLGRWQRTIAEDTVFGDDGALLCDGPGPLDLTGSYQLLDDKRISIAWPGAQHNTYAMAFIGDTLRLTLEGSSIGDGWTLTRKK
jgi:hypothetical protein